MSERDPELYGAPSAFAAPHGFLRGLPPQVLPLRRSTSIDVASLNVTIASNLTVRLATYNPSIARAPPGLCPRCTWVAAMRGDALHQCAADNPWKRPGAAEPRSMFASFKSTLIAVYDASWRQLGWTWLISSGPVQVHVPGTPVTAKSPHDRVEAGVADGFTPPLLKQVWDARLLRYGHRLFVTFNCLSCLPSLNLLHLTGDATPDGGVRQLRAWSQRLHPIFRPWARGRNQAYFVSGDGRLMVQPWLGLVGSFGTPRFGNLTVRCDERRGRRDLCGTTPLGREIAIDVIVAMKKPPGRHRLSLVRNESLSDLRVAGGHTLSTTAHLVPIRREACELLLGVGHLHRATGPTERKLARLRGDQRGGLVAAGRPPQRRDSGSERFEFGSQYTHFWYALDPLTFRIVATSGEWCLAAERDPRDCESVQFVSGVALDAVDRGGGGGSGGGDLVVSYGVTDCSAKVATLPLSGVWAALKPRDVSVAAQGGMCATGWGRMVGG